MNRRQLLGIAGVGAASLAGCSGTVDDGTDGGPLDGEWTLTGRIENTDDEPREWRVECRSESRGSSAAVSGTLPPGDVHEWELVGVLYDENREIVAESDGGSTSSSWRPTDCQRLEISVTISDGVPEAETDCPGE